MSGDYPEPILPLDVSNEAQAALIVVAVADDCPAVGDPGGQEMEMRVGLGIEIEDMGRIGETHAGEIVGSDAAPL
jgi:hypothetical protein